MGENINNVLGVDKTPESSQETIVYNTEIDKSAENTLSALATIILCMGLISAFICFFTMCIVADGYSGVSFSFYGLLVVLGIIFSTLMSWSVMKVLSNISSTLKDINSKIK